MTCDHCKQDRVFFDHNEYLTCSNCGHHRMKIVYVAMPNIPSPDRRYNQNQNKLGQLTMQKVVENLAEIKTLLKNRKSWFAITEHLTEKTGHRMHMRTVEKYYGRCTAGQQ